LTLKLTLTLNNKQTNSTVFLSDDATTFNLIRTRRLDGLSGPDYAALLPNGSSLICITDKPFKFTFDSLRPVNDAPRKTSENTDNDGNESIIPFKTLIMIVMSL